MLKVVAERGVVSPHIRGQRFTVVERGTGGAPGGTSPPVVVQPMLNCTGLRIAL
jgi:hypothetical protein